MRDGLRRVVPENHDVLAWLVHHAAATINWQARADEPPTSSDKWLRRFGAEGDVARKHLL